MNFKIIFRYLSVFLLMVFSVNVSAQKNDEAMAYFIIYQDLLNPPQEPIFYDGIIHLKDGNSVHGEVALNEEENRENFTILKNSNKWEYINNTEIDHVILFDEKDAKTTFYLQPERNVLLRKIYRQNGKTLFDSANFPFDNRLIAPVYVEENDSLINTFNFWTSGPKKDLVNYINDRDGKKYKNRDFKTLDDLFKKL